MKAAIYTEYGAPSVLRVVDVPKPVPKSNEILVKVHASGVTAGTLWARQGQFPDSKILNVIARLIFGITKPRKQILGYEYSGVVESVGSNITRFHTGDAVYGTTTGLAQGAYAEYICIPETAKQSVVAKKPQSLTFEEAAVLPVGGMTSFGLLRRANIKPYQNVLIYGASGSVGSYAVQIAKYYGARVTAVCSGRNTKIVQSLGADVVIDYTTTDITSLVGQFDVAFDAVAKLPSSVLKSLVKQDGKTLSVTSLTSEKLEYLETLERMIAENKLKPYLDNIYSLDDIALAHEYCDTGHKRGNVAISIFTP